MDGQKMQQLSCACSRLRKKCACQLPVQEDYALPDRSNFFESRKATIERSKIQLQYRLMSTFRMHQQFLESKIVGNTDRLGYESLLMNAHKKPAAGILS